MNDYRDRGGYLFDSSVWVAITFSSHPAHDTAMSALADTTVDRPACFCRATQQSFLRLITTPTILAAYGAPAMTNADAVRVHDELRALANVAYRTEPADIESAWPKLAARSTASPKLWMDAYLAAFAMKADLMLVTTDAGFRQFDDLNDTVLKSK
ncbi:MAG: PIN domain-containing protein [Anaerolineae bacterium]|nr:PIN domain-containing protein [Phycisphaerae bacterium]